MSVFLKNVIVEAPLKTVFAFHERQDALELLSPAFPPVHVIRREGGIEPGGRVELRIGPIRWVALHTAFEKNRLFEDRQIVGPFSQWLHRHEFEQAGTGTRLTDRITFALPGGTLVNHLFGWAVKLGLNQMFLHRHQTTKMYCEENSRENN